MPPFDPPSRDPDEALGFSQIDRYLRQEGEADQDTRVEGQLSAAERMRLQATRREFQETLPVDPADAAAAWGRLSARLASTHGEIRGSIRPLQESRATFTTPWRMLRRSGLLIGVGAALGSIALVVGHRFLTAPAPLIEKEYATQIGQRATVQLADGSVITLAPASKLRYVVTADGTRRDVYLDGEAYVTVVHNPAHPFTIYAGNASAQVLGTAFDIRHYADDRLVSTYVTEGRIAFSGVGVLVPGDVATLTNTGTATLRHHAGVSTLREWTTGVLAFEGEPFRDVIPRLERWYGIRIRVTDPALNAVPLTAVFRNQSRSNLVAVLSAVLEARVEEHGHVITLSSW